KPDRIPNSTQTVTYTDFKKVKNISLGSKSLVLDYGVDEQRRKGIFKDGSATFTRYYSGNYEEEVDSSGKVKKIHYISGGDGLAGIYINDDGNNRFYSTYCDYQGSLLALTDMNGVVKERYAYDPWGNRRNPASWKDTETRTKFIVDRGYTLHEHLDGFGLINMSGRVYDPLLGMFLSPDPYVQAPGNWLNYNRYGYCYGNPLSYTDPSGETAWLIPVIIGAVIGAYTGGTIANDGQYNPAKWDYSSGKTWGYMFGGAVAGGISGATGWAIAGSGMPMANTAAIAGSSLTNSLGTWAYTGGQTPVSISLGFASYDLKSSQWGYLGKKNNEWYENLGYGLGAMANLADFGKTSELYLNTEKKSSINHSAILEKDNSIIISEGPGQNWIEPKKAVDHYLNRFLGGSGATNEYPVHGKNMVIRNVNATTIKNYGKVLDFLTKKGKGIVPYSFLYSSCSTHTGLALNLSGIPTLFLHPYTVQASVWLWNNGITPSLINNSYHLQNYR
ncbi:RHS repeat domain-containing protein, partial [Bacteroides nordii]|uniref:RHS repeat domain-containing protein n=1 Tax=Bacteroides nordii TaxID=291645 RepID=UPI003AF8F1FB